MLSDGGDPGRCPARACGDGWVRAGGHRLRVGGDRGEGGDRDLGGRVGLGSCRGDRDVDVDGFLHAGEIKKQRIICPVHYAVFDLASGKCVDYYTYDTHWNQAGQILAGETIADFVDANCKNL